MHHYTVFYRIGKQVHMARIAARTADIAAQIVKSFYHGSIVTVEG